MLSTFKREIQSEIDRLKNLKEIVEFLNAELAKLEKTKKLVEDRLDKLNPATEALAELKDVAKSFLLDEAMKAVRETKEFNLPIFRNRLKAAINDKRTITLYVIENRLQVKINLDVTAGTLEDYAKAILETREKIYSARRKTWLTWVHDPFLASYMWEEKYYKPAREGTTITPLTPNRKVDTAKYKEKYWKTIRMRVASFNSLAPFWRIIDEGTQPLQSDWGGYGYPNFGRTNFVRKSTDRMQSYFTLLVTEKVNSIQHFIALLDQIDQKITYIQSLFENLVKGKTADLVRSTLEAHLKSKYPLADPLKREQLIQDLLNRVPISQEKVNLTQKGTGVRVRARVKELQAIVSRRR
jgi:hypothetical protein